MSHADHNAMSAANPSNTCPQPAGRAGLGWSRWPPSPSSADGGRDFYLQMLTQMMILAIFAMSLDLLQGVTGLVSLGHAAFFGWPATRWPSSRPTRPDQPVVEPAPGGAGRAGRAGHRLLRGAHPRHLLHHGDHGVRPDGVLPVLRQQGPGRLRRHLRQLQGPADAGGGAESTWKTRPLLLLHPGHAAGGVPFLRRLLFSPFGRVPGRASG
jgi:hypothetical protein